MLPRVASRFTRSGISGREGSLAIRAAVVTAQGVQVLGVPKPAPGLAQELVRVDGKAALDYMKEN